MAMMISASILVMFCGIVCLSDTELAWRVYEWDCRQMNISISRPINWIMRVKLTGYGLLGLGIVGIFVSTNL